MDQTENEEDDEKRVDDGDAGYDGDGECHHEAKKEKRVKELTKTMKKRDRKRTEEERKSERWVEEVDIDEDYGAELIAVADDERMRKKKRKDFVQVYVKDDYGCRRKRQNVQIVEECMKKIEELAAEREMKTVREEEVEEEEPIVLEEEKEEAPLSPESELYRRKVEELNCKYEQVLAETNRIVHRVYEVKKEVINAKKFKRVLVQRLIKYNSDFHLTALEIPKDDDNEAPVDGFEDEEGEDDDIDDVIQDTDDEEEEDDDDDEEEDSMEDDGEETEIDEDLDEYVKEFEMTGRLPIGQKRGFVNLDELAEFFDENDELLDGEDDEGETAPPTKKAKLTKSSNTKREKPQSIS